MNFGDDVFQNRAPDVEDVARRIRDRGIAPEIEIYDAGHLDAAKALIQKGLVSTDKPLHFQFVLGVRGGLSASAANLDFLVSQLPSGGVWAVAGVGRHQLPMAELAVLRGGHARVGLEDNICLEKGVLSKGSAPLVEKIAAFARDRGRAPATPSEARTLLGLASS
jgi:3-keto-5-aminohexanoate cleavage enzyme